MRTACHNRKRVALYWQIAAMAAATCLLAVQATAACAAEIFWVSDPVRPGETVLVTGEDFGAAPRVRVALLPEDGYTATPAASAVMDGDTLALKEAQQVALRIPSEWRAGIYKLEIDGEGRRATALVNVPRIYFVQGSSGVHAIPGGWLRIFGRNVQAPGKRARLRLGLRGGGQPLTLAATAGDDWTASFRLPFDMQAGAFDLEYHNGWGGELGWTAGGSLTVAPEAVWPQRHLMVTDFGAKGDGNADDTAAVQRALDAAGEAGGGVVFLPRGRYKLTDGLKLKPFVTLAGAGRDRVALAFIDFTTPPPALISGPNHFALRDFSLFASNHKRIISDDAAQAPGRAGGGVAIERLLIRASIYRRHPKGSEVGDKYQAEYSRPQADAISLGGAELRIVDSDVYGSGRPLVLILPRGALVAGNRFHVGRTGWYSIAGGDGVIFEKNEIIGADLMSSGGGVNTMFGASSSRNIYFAENTLRMMNGVDREAMTTDGSGGYYYGRVAPEGADKWRVFEGRNEKFTAVHTSWSGASFFILGGRGRGQFAKVVSIDGDVVSLDREFAVPPDAGSTVTIVPTQENYLFLRNTFEDTGVAVQFYGTSVNHVVAANRTVRASGLFAMGRWYNHYQPSWYCQFLENEIADGNTYRGGPNSVMFAEEAKLSFETFAPPPNTAPLLIGGIARRNRLLGNAHISVGVTTGGRSTPALDGVLIEDNIVRNSAIGIRVDPSTKGVVISRNSIGN